MKDTGNIKNFFCSHANPIDALSDDEFLVLSQHFKTLDTLAEKAIFIIKYSNYFNDYFSIVERNILGQNHQIGLSINYNYPTLVELAEAFIKVLAEQTFNTEFEKINNRLRQCNIVEREDLINHELECIKIQFAHYLNEDPNFVLGYNSTYLKYSPFHLNDYILRNYNDNVYGTLLGISRGIAHRKLEIALKTQLKTGLGKEHEGLDKRELLNNNIHNDYDNIFCSKDAGDRIMDQLVKEDLIENGSYKWKDNSQGYEGRISLLINTLWYRNYLNPTSKKPSAKKMVAIGQRLFGVKISERTCQQKENQFRPTSDDPFAFIKPIKPQIAQIKTQMPLG